MSLSECYLHGVKGAHIGVIADQAHTFELLHLGRKDEQVSDHIYWNKGYTIIPSRDSQYLLIISLNII